MPNLDLPEAHQKLLDEAHEGAHDEIAAALSAAKKLQVIAAIGIDQHHEYVDPFSVAERKALSLVVDNVQPPEQRAAVTGIVGFVIGRQAHAHDRAVESPVIDHALRKAIAHAVIALEVLGGSGSVVDDAVAAHDKTPSKFASPALDALATAPIATSPVESSPVEAEHSAFSEPARTEE